MFQNNSIYQKQTEIENEMTIQKKIILIIVTNTFVKIIY